jgi:hypothetical protein
MTERMEWRQLVRKSKLPSSVKLTLLTHSESGKPHKHDEERNLHAYSRKRLADRLGVDESTIRRHYRRAEEARYLAEHERGHRGIGQHIGKAGGRTSVFHYVTKDDPWPCESCNGGSANGVQNASLSDAGLGGSYYPLSNDRDAPPISTPAGTPAPVSQDHPQTADQADPAPDSPRSCALPSAPHSAAAPASDLSQTPGRVPDSATGRTREATTPTCAVCGDDLHPAAAAPRKAGEPWFTMHPSCDLAAFEAADDGCLLALLTDMEPTP